jgi:iduronate 2-sulfatase
VGLIDLYPTLLELCGLEADPALEGRSLRPLLEEPEREWPWPTLTTFGPGNHSVRSTHWRYVRYGDGNEELYDHRSDPHEFTNLAADERFVPVLAEHRRWIPKNPAPLREGSGSAGLDAWRAAEALAD